MKRDIIHLFGDQKVVTRGFMNFQEGLLEYNHIGILFLEDENIKHVSMDDGFVIYNKSIFDFLNIDNIACVFIHFLSTDKLRFIYKLPKNIPICWHVYGGDLYNRYLNYMGYQIYYVENVKQSCWRKLLYPIKKLIRNIEFRFLLNRVRVFSACSCDYDLIKENDRDNNPSLNVELFSYTMGEIMGDLYNSQFVKGNSIIIGNSASYTNNHLYCLRYLRELDISGYDVILQLAYGGDDSYKSLVKEKFVNDLNCPIHSNETFIPLDKYNYTLQQAHAFIFGNWRQEAIGNILVALYLGKKVYLSNKNPLLNYFRKQGFGIFELESIDGNLLNELSVNEKKHNRKLADRLYSKERLIQLMRTGFKDILR